MADNTETPLIDDGPRSDAPALARAALLVLGASVLAYSSGGPPAIAPRPMQFAAADAPSADEAASILGAALSAEASLTMPWDAGFAAAAPARNALKQDAATGHDYDGRSQASGDGLGLDLGRLRWARVLDETDARGRRLMSLGPATPMLDAYEAGAPHGLVPLARARVVLSDGTVVVADDGPGASARQRDLLYALRGGGAAPGVVTEFVVAVHPAPATVRHVAWTAPFVAAGGYATGRAALKRFFHNATWWEGLDRGWGGWSSASCRDAARFRAGDADAGPAGARGGAWGLLEARLIYAGDGSGYESLRELLDWAPVGGDARAVETDVRDMVALMRTEGGDREGQYERQLISNVFVDAGHLANDDLTDLVANALDGSCAGGAAWGPLFFYNHVLGGRVGELGEGTSVANGFRSALFEVGANDAWAESADDAARGGALVAAAARLYAFSSSSYGNEFTDAPLLDRDWKDRFYGDHYGRLLAVKADADPCNNVFRAERGVGADVDRFAACAPFAKAACGTTARTVAVDRTKYGGTWYKQFVSTSLAATHERGKRCIQVHMDPRDGGTFETVVKWRAGAADGAPKSVDATVTLGDDGTFEERGVSIPYDVVHVREGADGLYDLAVVYSSCVGDDVGAGAWVMTREPELPAGVDVASLQETLAAAGVDAAVRLEKVTQATCAAWAPSKTIARARVAVRPAVCGGDSEDALVAYPDDGGRYPLVALEHGALYDKAESAEHCAGDVEACYGALIEDVARAGFVVAAPASEKTGWCQRAAEDQANIVTFAAAKRSSSAPEDAVWRRVDWDRGAGLLGHSMGGVATLVNADDYYPLVAAAVAVAPYTADAWREAHDGPVPRDHLLGAKGGAPGRHARAAVAVFGSAEDATVPPGALRAAYDGLPATTDRLLVVLPDRSHRGLKEDHVLSASYAAFLACHLKDDDGACARLGAESELCAGAICERGGGL
ncbi:hypothetical protein JL720_8885 [Aureococcus anophagefferens]|nr:hypothetical protein JL720_8885 [Aureococcus anophagefferens]